MSYEAQLLVMGETYDIDFVNVTYYRNLGFKNRPAPYVMGGIIDLQFRASTKDDRLEWWMLHTEEGEFCKLTQGELVVYSDKDAGQVAYTYKFNDAALKSYRSIFNHQTGMVTRIQITAAIQEFRGQTHIKSWQESLVFGSSNSKYQEETVNEFQIVKAHFEDTQGNPIQEMHSGDAVLVIETQKHTDQKLGIEWLQPLFAYKRNSNTITDNQLQDIAITGKLTKIPLTLSQYIPLEQRTQKDQGTLRVYQMDKPSHYTDVTELKPIPFQAVVTFHRSQLHMEGNYGKNDTQYKGTFGFDRFDKKVMGQGLAEDYARVEGIKTKKPVAGNSHQHRCAYLSLYPPNTKGNRTQVSLYANTTPNFDYQEDTDVSYGIIGFRSSNPEALEITSQQEKHLQRAYLTLNEKNAEEHYGNRYDTFVKIDLKCHQAFEEEVYITAEDAQGKVLGKIICMPNATRYETELQFIQLDIGNVESTRVQEIPNTSFAQDVAKEFNRISFNQAFINATLAPSMHKIMLKKSELSKYLTTTATGKTALISKDLARNYNSIVEKRYAAILLDQRELNRIEEELKEKGQEMLEAFDRQYNFKTGRSLDYVRKLKEEAYVTNIIAHKRVKPKIEAYKEVRARYDAIKGEGEAAQLNKKHRIHIFITPSIDQAYANAAAYSLTGGAVAHIFQSLIEHPTAIAGTLHEIGHSLGLHHTFSDKLEKTIIREENVVYKSDVEISIKTLKDDMLDYKDNLNRLIQNKKSDISNTQSNTLRNLKAIYNNLENAMNLKSSFNSNVDFFDTSFLNQLNIASNIELGNKIYIKEESNTISSLRQNIISLEESIKNKKKLLDNSKKSKLYNRQKKQSKTLENYMDYGITTEGNDNKDVLRKVYYHWQWKIMQQQGKASKYLTPKQND